MDREKNVDPLVAMQQELCDMWGINNQTKYVFYYDESNNCRKFWVDDNKQQFNTDYTADFVLAGLVKKEEDTVDVSLESFRKILKLQANVEEIKFKKLYSKGDFLQCVKEKRLFETLSWIDKSPFFIHYTNVNNLFYTLVEIFDSIVSSDEIIEFGYDYLKMKSIFYYMFKEKADELQKLMFKYRYPNIQRENIEMFCNELLFLLGSRKEMREEEKFLAGMLARAAKSDELIFLHDNDDYIMQENYAEFYIDPIRKYQKSTHIFDEEMTVQEIVKNQIAQGENMSDKHKKALYLIFENRIDGKAQLTDGLRKNLSEQRRTDLNIQIFGTKKCNDTKKAERFFKERGIKYQFIDMKEKGMSKGEFNSVAQDNGGLNNMLNWDGKDKDLLALIKYIADEDKLDKVLENPQIIKTPVVRNGKQSTLGYQPDVWKGWN